MHGAAPAALHKLAPAALGLAASPKGNGLQAPVRWAWVHATPGCRWLPFPLSVPPSPPAARGAVFAKAAVHSCGQTIQRRGRGLGSPLCREGSGRHWLSGTGDPLPDQAWSCWVSLYFFHPRGQVKDTFLPFVGEDAATARFTEGPDRCLEERGICS